MSLSNKVIEEAFRKGYRVMDGKVTYRGRFIKGHKQKKGKAYYLYIGVRYLKKPKKIPVHRLVAYQKYGEVTFLKGVQVRHLDGNSENNTESNIAIGTASQNQMDKTEETRKRMALHASSFIKIHDHDKIIKSYQEGKSYKTIMDETGIKSKGTISFIIRKSEAAVRQ
jgi:hypothetical protein